MGTNVGGGGGTTEQPSYKTKGQKLVKSLVIDEIKIIEETRIYPVPKVKYVEEEQTRYKTTDENQIRYVTEDIPTVKYSVKDQDTIKYCTKEEETIKYVAKEVECEKPVLVDKLYERPVLKEKEYTVVTLKDMEAINQLIKVVPTLIANIAKIEDKLKGLFDYKLVERVIDVPKINWVPREEERIIWKNVERERPNASKDR